MLIEYAPLVQVARIAPEAAAKNEMDPAEIVRVQGKPYWVFDRHDVVPGKDFFNVRSWLIHNDNYDWRRAAGRECWRLAIQSVVYRWAPTNRTAVRSHERDG